MTKKQKNRAALYLRVSTKEQTTDNQRLALEKIAEAKELEIVKVYEDVGLSGKLGRDQRPALKQMMKDATAKEFDVLMVWSADRLGRSTSKVAEIMDELNHLKIRQYYDQQSCDTSTPYGRAMIEMAAVFASLEREIIVERVKAGLDRAKAEGTKLGRPKQITDKKARVITLRRAMGDSIRTIAEKVELSPASVHAFLKQQA